MRPLNTATAVPAARSEGLLIEHVGDETVIYDMVSKHAHCLKPLAALVFDCSDGRTTAGEIARTAEQRLGFGVTEADVADAVSQLGSLGLLQTPLVVLPGVEGNGNGVSRREMLRRVGFAGAAAATATTLVTSIVARHTRAGRLGDPVGLLRLSGQSRLHLQPLLPEQPGEAVRPILLRRTQQLLPHHGM